MAAELRDANGNPVELTDELGNPVTLTDEHGNPVHITGLATSAPLEVSSVVVTDVPLASSDVLKGTSDDANALKVSEVSGEERVAEHVAEERKEEKAEDGVGAGAGEAQRSQSSTSSSSSSEDDGQGGRRRKKKKGIAQKLKEKLTIGKHHKDDKIDKGVHERTQEESAAASTIPATIEHPSTAEEHHSPEHEKKSVFEKIKEKLPGHHNH